MANQATSLTCIIKAAGYSYKGIADVWRHEAAFRQELVVAMPSYHTGNLAECGCDSMHFIDRIGGIGADC